MVDLDKIYKIVIQQCEIYDIDKLVLYGSRARGDNKPTSDVDLAIYGDLSRQDQLILSSYIKEDLPTLLEFDVVFVNETTTPELVENIEKDGVILYEKV